MPLGDVTEQQNHVSSYYGGDSSLVPASFDWAIFTGNPYAGGVETSYPDYTRQTITNDTSVFVPGDDGSATATVTPVAIGDPGDPDYDWDALDDGLCWVLLNGSAIDSWDFLATPVPFDGPGDIEDIEITPFIANDESVSA